MKRIDWYEIDPDVMMAETDCVLLHKLSDGFYNLIRLGSPILLDKDAM